jgi:hypothetical protein
MPIAVSVECEPTPFSAYTEPFEQPFVMGDTPRDLTPKEEATGWGYVEFKAKGAKKRARRRMGKKAEEDHEHEEGECVSIQRVWLRAGEHKSGQLAATKDPKPVPHSKNEKMLSWRAMPTTSSYDIMANPQYGELLAACPFFDQVSCEL